MKSDVRDSSAPDAHPSTSSMVASPGVNDCSNQACSPIHAAASNHQQSPGDSTVTLHHLGQLTSPIQQCSISPIPNSTSGLPDFSHRRNRTFHSDHVQIAGHTNTASELGHTHSELDVGGLETSSGLEYVSAAQHSITGLETASELGHAHAGLGHGHVNGGLGHVCGGLGYALGHVGVASTYTRHSIAEGAFPYSVGDQPQSQRSPLTLPTRSPNEKNLPVPVPFVSPSAPLTPQSGGGGPHNQSYGLYYPFP